MGGDSARPGGAPEAEDLETPPQFHDEIIAAAGGSNAHQDDKASYPQISAMGIIRLAPDVIVDLLSPMQTGGQTLGRIKQQWSRLRTFALRIRHSPVCSF